MTQTVPQQHTQHERTPPRVDHRAVPWFDPAAVQRVHQKLDPILKWYFRSEVRGLEHIPTEPTLVVTHHDGGMLPLNGICLGAAWHGRFGFQRPLYVLTHDLFHGLPWGISQRFARIGMIRADRVAMDAALTTGASVLVFPGAARESFRPFWERHRIDLGGRTGFISQAIRWGLPITPVVSAGGHEALLVLSRGDALARFLGIPNIVRSADVFPLQAGLPWGLWALPFLPYLPLPARITTQVQAPIWLPDVLGRKLRPQDADDPDTVRAGFDHVLRTMQSGLDELYSARRWPVLG